MRDLLEKLASGEISVTEAEKLIRVTAIQEIEHLAKIDNGRELRKGIPEIILADGKSPEAIRDIILKIMTEAERVIVSRASISHVEAIKQDAPLGVSLEGDAKMRTLVLRKNDFKTKV